MNKNAERASKEAFLNSELEKNTQIIKGLNERLSKLEGVVHKQIQEKSIFANTILDMEKKQWK